LEPDLLTHATAEESKRQQDTYTTGIPPYNADQAAARDGFGLDRWRRFGIRVAPQ